jgi:hypothetical protein
VDVAARQPPVGVLDLAERVRRGDRDLELAVGDQAGQFGQRRRAGSGRVAVTLDSVLGDRGEIGDGVDP